MSNSKASPQCLRIKSKSASLIISSLMGQPRRISNQKNIGQQQSLNSYVMCFSQSKVSSTGRFSQLFRIGSMGQMQGSSGSRPASGTNNKQSFDLLVFDSFLISVLQLKMFSNSNKR